MKRRVDKERGGRGARTKGGEGVKRERVNRRVDEERGGGGARKKGC